jgi:8-amino-7-oxononanoate synthase
VVLRLHQRARLLRRRLGERALPGAHPSSPIVAVLVGDPVRTMELDLALWECGYLVQGLRPPTVEPGTSRLRLVVSAVHTEAEIEGVAAAVLSVVADGAQP